MPSSARAAAAPRRAMRTKRRPGRIFIGGQKGGTAARKAGRKVLADGRLAWSSDAPALEDALVIGALESGGVGAVAEVHRAADFVDGRVVVLRHPLLQTVEQGGEKTGAVF